MYLLKTLNCNSYYDDDNDNQNNRSYNNDNCCLVILVIWLLRMCRCRLDKFVMVWRLIWLSIFGIFIIFIYIISIPINLRILIFIIFWRVKFSWFNITVWLVFRWIRLSWSAITVWLLLIVFCRDLRNIWIVS